MRVYLNAGFGDPLGGATLRAIADAGFDGIRQDVPSATTARSLCDDLTGDARLGALLLVGSRAMALGSSVATLVGLARATARAARESGLASGPTPPAFEIGNEPDLAAVYRSSPIRAAEAIRASADAVWEWVPGATVVTGGISNLHARGLRYLQLLIDADIPGRCVVGVHRYQIERAPEVALPGHRTVADEIDAARWVARGRRVWITETGWPSATWTTRRLLWWRRRHTVTEAQQGDWLVRALAGYRALDVPLVSLYQHRDGVGPGVLDHYGLWRSDTTLKPSGLAVSTWLLNRRP